MQAKCLVRSCKSEAQRALKKSHLYFPMLLITVLSFLSFCGIFAISFAIEGMLFPDRHVQPVSILLSLAFSLLCLTPLLRGVKMLPLHGTLFTRNERSLLFYCFTHRHRYVYAVRKAVGVLFRVSLCLFTVLSIVFGGEMLAKHLLYRDRGKEALLMLALGAGVLLLLLFLFSLWQDSSFLLDAVHLSAPLLSYRQARALSLRAMRRGRAVLWRLRLSFLPLWMLSLLFFGLPLFFVFPYYWGARAHLAVSLIQN